MLQNLYLQLNEYSRLLNARLYSASSTMQEQIYDDQIVGMEAGINEELTKERQWLDQNMTASVETEEAKLQLEDQLRERQLELRQLTEKYYHLKNNYINKQKEILKKSYLAVHPKTDPKLLDNINYSDKVTLHNFFDQDLQNAEVRQLYNQIHQRHNDLLKLEADLRHLKQLFVTASILIQNQGLPMIKVEQQVDTAANATTAATEQLQQANKLAANSRKKKWLLAAGVGLTAVVVAVSSSLPSMLHR